MKTKNILCLLCLLMAGMMAMTASSCSDDEENEMQNNGKDPLVPTPEGLRASAAQQIIKNLCDVDSVNGQATYDFKLGEVLDATQPTEFSVGVNDLDEAVDMFRNSIVGSAWEPVDMNGVLQVDLQEQGSMVFSPGGTDGALATVTLNLAGLPTMTRLSFIPATLWPDNANSPFVKGNIVYDRTEKCTYVCIAAYDTGREGLLLTLDKGWTILTNNDKDEMSIQGNKIMEYRNMPSESDMNMLYDYFTSRHDDLIARLLLAFPQYQETGTFSNWKRISSTSSHKYSIAQSNMDEIVTKKDSKRDAFDRKMREQGFHMNTSVHEYWAWFEYWHEYWFYAYRLRNNGGAYGERYEVQYIDSQGSSYVSPKFFILCHTKRFGSGSFDNSRYELKRR